MLIAQQALSSCPLGPLPRSGIADDESELALDSFIAMTKHKSTRRSMAWRAFRNHMAPRISASMLCGAGVALTVGPCLHREHDATQRATLRHHASREIPGDSLSTLGFLSLDALPLLLEPFNWTLRQKYSASVPVYGLLHHRHPCYHDAEARP